MFFQEFLLGQMVQWKEVERWQKAGYDHSSMIQHILQGHGGMDANHGIGWWFVLQGSMFLRVGIS
jgi:hypothetical protein